MSMPMQGYRYQQGDRPLSGYTIQAAAGRGGFGEVYYAVSDSGREVALKAVQGHTQIEMRGIAQCMNLKSPHLVTIFDLRRNDDGDPFVIMEYIAGPSLRQLIDAQPAGLGPAKAAFFLREIVKGLAYLHNCGIVHRDLKPANIFFENGLIKIGDYGLAKAISTDHHASQTVTVGTVHYMAPEIGSGQYDRSIDIYALGILLYEMLTGRVPFRGNSPSEVLMKHLTGEPELDGVSEPFRGVIAKALAKDPEQRYATVEEMVDDLFDAEAVRQDVSSIGPQELSVVADKVAGRLRGATDSGPGGESVGTLQPAYPSSAAGPGPVAAVARPHMMEDRLAQLIDGDNVDSGVDPLTAGRRFTLTLVALVLVALATGYLTSGGGPVGLKSAGLIFFSLAFALGATLGLRAAQTRLLPALSQEAEWFQRLSAAGAGVAAGALLSGLLISVAAGSGTIEPPPSDVQRLLLMTALAVGGALLLWDWRQPLDRPERLALSQAVGPAFIAWLLAYLVSGIPLLALGTTVAIAFAIQTLSPWRPRSKTTAASGSAAPRAAAAGQPAHAVAQAGPLPQASPAPAAPPPLQPQPAASRPSANGSAALAADDRRSPLSRLVALLLSGVVLLGLPIFGLHRFYAGKIGTGILWLLTFGIFGIGQLIDAILIVAGAFRDADNRPLLDWSLDGGAPPAAAAGAAASASASQGTQVSTYGGGKAVLRVGVFVAGAVAWLAILAAIAMTLIIGLGAALAVAAEMGSPGMHGALIQAGNVAAFVLLAFAAVLMVVTRGGAGSFHALRALIGIGGLAVLLTATQAYLLRQLPGQLNNPGQWLDHLNLLAQSVPPYKVLVVLGLITTFLVFIAWPAANSRSADLHAM